VRNGLERVDIQAAIGFVETNRCALRLRACIRGGAGRGHYADKEFPRLPLQRETTRRRRHFVPFARLFILYLQSERRSLKKCIYKSRDALDSLWAEKAAIN
jgi:hypothetical protein